MIPPMDDLTKRLVEALKDHHSKVVHTMQLPNNCHTCALIHEAESQGGGWIKVTDRLSVEPGVYDVWDRVHGRRIPNVEFDGIDWISTAYRWSGVMSHYRPLPTPPGGQ